MFTVCPKCALTLVVTAADLRVAQGFVRCGRCSNVFNAVAALSDERQAAAAALEATNIKRPDVKEEPDIREEEAEPANETVEYVEPDPQPREEAISDAALEFDPGATDVSKVFVAPAADDEATGTFEAIVLKSEEELEPEAPAERAEDPLDAELRSLAARIDAGDHAPASRPQIWKPEPVASENVAPESVIEETGTYKVGDADSLGRHPIVWRAGVAALVVMLAVQAVHHYRHDLAVDPRMHGPLTKIYSALGVSLVPRWDVGAYEVHQLGASTGPADNGRLMVRASLKNAASQPQPQPLLRVAVQDRFGNRIAARDVAPQSYLPRTVRAGSFLAPGQRLDVEMEFVDPGREAVGFEIDACLPVPGGSVACANPR